MQFDLKGMIKIIIKYFISFILLILIGIMLMDYMILPIYVGYNNEHYLPDIRGEFIEKANYQLKSLGFKTEVINIPFSKLNKPGTVTKMLPRAFTKAKEGRTIKLYLTVIIDNKIKQNPKELKNLTDKKRRWFYVIKNKKNYVYNMFNDT